MSSLFLLLFYLLLLLWLFSAGMQRQPDTTHGMLIQVVREHSCLTNSSCQLILYFLCHFYVFFCVCICLCLVFIENKRQLPPNFKLPAISWLQYISFCTELMIRVLYHIHCTCLFILHGVTQLLVLKKIKSKDAAERLKICIKWLLVMVFVS